MVTTRKIARSVVAFAVTVVASVALVDTVDASHHASAGCCQPVGCPCPVPVPKVSTTICLYDACTCTTTQATLCLPATCCGEPPQITWRSGIFGRRIATLCWPCCGYMAEVVVTRHGRVIVRD